ncbi:hypothetical protein GCM10010174_84550 [Kutzneria viridogrisea]|uniref:Secreted protein n=2 Tax=Kutzneria TaxID=43356 RepID=W5W5R9_9PSEU|nr:HAD domain-containing protein [Kutzneria albida]AHH95821.1 hypothetical protein KALB_2453 [Kutzneria albida DSM 43870]MBA8926659.1 hypothetical protein [Kutzneria viridogrisea]
MDKPWLLLDVDGPLNPFRAMPGPRPHGYTSYRTKPSLWPHASALRVWLNAAHGARLRALPFDLVWATTWQGEANEWISPPLHLPKLPVIEWPRRQGRDPEGLHWKTRHAVRWAAGRPFAWVDDEISEADRAWVREHHDRPALLRWVDPGLGLREQDFAALLDWSKNLRTAG